MIAELNNIECITLFVEELLPARKFYLEIFSAQLVYEDQNCAVVKLENIMLNLLKISEADQLIKPAKVGSRNAGARLMFTIRVTDVNQVCARLKEYNVKLLNGPIDRPWGRRTAAFNDPAGNAWEIAQELTKTSN
jgi:lactoylglutathione lyase